MTDSVGIRVEQISIRFPIYGADHRSLKKHLARIAIGGRLGAQGGHSTPVVSALNDVSFQLAPGDRLALVGIGSGVAHAQPTLVKNTAKNASSTITVKIANTTALVVLRPTSSEFPSTFMP